MENKNIIGRFAMFIIKWIFPVQIVFLVLRAFNGVDWPKYIVFSPMIITGGILILLIVLHAWGVIDIEKRNKADEHEEEK